jgi:curved DNA-binding protein CbpA
MIDLYDLLGVARVSPPEVISKAYRHAARDSHPDAGGTHERFVELRLAHEILSDAEFRSHYDALLDAAAALDSLEQAVRARSESEIDRCVRPADAAVERWQRSRAVKAPLALRRWDEQLDARVQRVIQQFTVLASDSARRATDDPYSPSGRRRTDGGGQSRETNFRDSAVTRARTLVGMWEEAREDWCAHEATMSVAQARHAVSHLYTIYGFLRGSQKDLKLVRRITGGVDTRTIEIAVLRSLADAVRLIAAVQIRVDRHYAMKGASEFEREVRRLGGSVIADRHSVSNKRQSDAADFNSEPDPLDPVRESEPPVQRHGCSLAIFAFLAVLLVAGAIVWIHRETVGPYVPIALGILLGLPFANARSKRK